MDKFVENIVASVLGTPETAKTGVAGAVTVARPNYQRQKQKGRLLVTEYAPASATRQPVAAPAPHRASPITDLSAAMRRVSLAAATPDHPVKAAGSGQGCACNNACQSRCAGSSSASLSIQKIANAPRRLGEVVGIRLQPGDVVVSLSVNCPDAGRLIATDEYLTEQGIAPEAIAYTPVGQDALLITVSTSSALADTLITRLDSLWQGCSGCGKGALSPSPSAKLLNYWGISRRGALGVIDSHHAADLMSALSLVLQTNNRLDVRLKNRVLFLHGSSDEIRSAIDAIHTTLSTSKR